MTIAMKGTPGETARVRSALTALGAQLSDAFVYLPEGETGSDLGIEVSLSGPDNDVLRATAGRRRTPCGGPPG